MCSRACLRESRAWQAEGKDRTSLLLPMDQDALIATVAAAGAAEGIAVVLIVMSGGPVDLSAAKADANVGAIVWCGYPGQWGGMAVADAIFGRTNPSGRLTMTWYDESFARAVRLTDMGMRPNASTGHPGRTHRFFTGTPVFGFGHGLSYTSFAIAPPDVQLSRFALTAAASEAHLTRSRSSVVGHAIVRVTNTGHRTGGCGVLLFAAPPHSSDWADSDAFAGAPRQNVVDFGKLSLAPGETATLAFELRSRDLTYAGRTGGRVAPAGVWSFWSGAASDGADEAAVTRQRLEA